MTHDEDSNETEDRKQEGGEEYPPFLEYLETEKGHELASRVVSLIEDIKKATLDVNADHAKRKLELGHKQQRNTLILQSIVFVLAIVSATLLTYLDRFSPSLGLLIGTLVGYFFGKKIST